MSIGRTSATIAARGLSHGWRSNAQWVTDFRRDYATEDAHYYKVDGPEELFDAKGQLAPGVAYQFSSATSAIVVMTHRRFIRTLEQLYEKALCDNTDREPRVDTARYPPAALARRRA